MKKWLLLVFCIPILASCWDVTEPERMYYVLGVGIDYVDDEYEIYTQIIDFTNVAKSEQPNPEAVQTEIGRSKGKTIDEAFFKMYNSTDMRLFWGHLSFVVFSEEALKEGRANTVLNSFNRYRETRYQIWVYATGEKLEDVLLATPILNKAITLSKLVDPENSFEQQSNIVPKNFRDIIVAFDEPNYSVAIPYVTLDDKWANEKGPLKTIRLDGVAFVHKDGLRFVAKQDQVQGLQWLTSGTERTEVTFMIRDEAVSATIEYVKLKVKPLKDAKFDVKIHLHAIVSGFNTELTSKEAKKHITKEIEKQVRETYAFGMVKGQDIYRLSHQLYKKDVQQWRDVEQNGQIPLTNDTISHVEVVIEKLSSARKEFSETIK